MYFLLIHHYVLHAIHSKNFILSIQKVQRKHRWRFLYHLMMYLKKKKKKPPKKKKYLKKTLKKKT